MCITDIVIFCVIYSKVAHIQHGSHKVIYTHFAYAALNGDSLCWPHTHTPAVSTSSSAKMSIGDLRNAPPQLLTTTTYSDRNDANDDALKTTRTSRIRVLLKWLKWHNICRSCYFRFDFTRWVLFCSNYTIPTMNNRSRQCGPVQTGLICAKRTQQKHKSELQQVRE